MPAIRIAGFAGENRAIYHKLLPDAVGVTSRNQKPGRGDLRPWKSPSTVATVPASRQSIYRMGRDTATDATYWLSWTAVVHAMRGFDQADTTERTYYSGDGAPKVTSNVVAALDGTDPQDNPSANRPLGVPAPASAPTVSNIAGGSSNTSDTSFYVYTYVTDWGWESAPSPVSTENTRLSDQQATITDFATVPAGNYNINRIRIYRTQAGESGAASFFFLREIAYGTASTTDDNRSLGETLATTSWLPAPGVPNGGAGNPTEANLSFLTPLWNGMAAGISAGGVRFCEPYTMYAWPLDYEILPPDSKAVALGVVGQSLLVLTSSRPLLVSGSSPDSMDQQLLEIPQGCVAPNSVASMGSGVAWASEDGLCWYGAGGAKIITAGIMSREDWQALVPSSITGRMYEGLYFGSYSTDGGSTRQGFFINPIDPTGIYFLDTGYSASYFDELRDQLYVLSGQNVQKWDAGSAMTYTFKSKTFKMARPMSMSCVEVLADSYPVTCKVYADGVLKHTQTVANSDPFRLPSGFLASEWAVQLEGTAPIQGAVMATSMAELAQL